MDVGALHNVKKQKVDTDHLNSRAVYSRELCQKAWEGGGFPQIIFHIFPLLHLRLKSDHFGWTTIFLSTVFLEKFAQYHSAMEDNQHQL